MKILRNGAEWGNGYYVYWWNWLPKEYRYLGFEIYWYDGPHYSFGFWFFNWSWSSKFWDKYLYRYLAKKD